MDKPKYKRILLKLSGEALSSDGEVLEPSILEQYAQEIKKIHDLGVEVAIVIGGGNIFRGASAAKVGIDRVQGDYMGMLATVINGMAIQASLEKHGVYPFDDCCQNRGCLRTYDSSSCYSSPRKRKNYYSQCRNW
jgi:uridylate kinase